jgi:hypothetical protein
MPLDSGNGGDVWGLGTARGGIAWEGMGVSGAILCLVQGFDGVMGDFCTSFEFFDTREGDDLGMMTVLTVDGVDTGFSTTPSSFSLHFSSWKEPD